MTRLTSDRLCSVCVRELRAAGVTVLVEQRGASGRCDMCGMRCPVYKIIGKKKPSR